MNTSRTSCIGVCVTGPSTHASALVSDLLDDMDVSTLLVGLDGESVQPTSTDDLEDVFGLVGTELDKKYSIECLVAEGGFGVVYRGTHIALQKPIAIKVLKTPAALNNDARAEFLARFTQEARMIAQLDHPAVVRVLDSGASPLPNGESAPWMVMEWLTGTTLEDDLEARRGQGGRPPAACLALLRPVFEALAAAHDERIAHRDIKPANIMLVKGRRGDVTLKLLDFGISKLMRPEEANASGRTATQTLLPAFSPDYAAPEQIASMRTGPWTDVHAMALVLTELLTDMNAYVGTDTAEMYASVLASQRPTPGRFRLDVGPWEQVLARALSLKPTERYQHSSEFLAALEARVPASARWKQVTAKPAERPMADVTTMRGTAVETLSESDLEDDPSPHPPTRFPWLVTATAACALLVAFTVRSVTHPSPMAIPHAAMSASVVAPIAFAHTTATAVAAPPVPAVAVAPSPIAAPSAVAVAPVVVAHTPRSSQTASVARPLPSVRPSVVRRAGPVVHPTSHSRTSGDDIPVE